MTEQKQPEALRLAEQYDYGDPVAHSNMWKAAVCNALRRQHARIAELEAQLSAIGAGGVSGPLMGCASIAASAGSEPVAVRDAIAHFRLTHWADEDGGLGLADALSKLYGDDDIGRANEELDSLADAISEVVTHPSPPEGMVGGLQVYRCKIKSRKQIDREIPRELQGWWADVAAGQKLLLRQAVQSDLDRCNIGGKRSRNPTDYMCETHTYGSLVSKTALEYMSPEENVFAAPPTTSAGSGKGE